MECFDRSYISRVKAFRKQKPTRQPICRTEQSVDLNGISTAPIFYLQSHLRIFSNITLETKQRALWEDLISKVSKTYDKTRYYYEM
jgi:hypothetical protein